MYYDLIQTADPNAENIKWSWRLKSRINFYYTSLHLLLYYVIKVNKSIKVSFQFLVSKERKDILIWFS